MNDFKLVPVKPTPEMERAAESYWNERRFMGLSDDPRTLAGVYQAMLAAAPAVQGEPEIEPYDAGSLNDFGGGDVGWWHDYIRAELDRAYEFYLIQLAAAPQPTPTTPTGEQKL